jgi:hypothetical protein
MIFWEYNTFEIVISRSLNHLQKKSKSFCFIFSLL